MASSKQQIDIAELKAIHGDVYHWGLFCADYDQELAQEVVQQAYLKILEGRARFSGNATLKTWVFSVVRLTCLELKRARGKHDSGSGKDEQELLGQHDVPVLMTLPETDNSSIAEAIKQLSLMQREIVYLHFYRDMPLSEIAQTLDTSVGTISSQYDRAKKKLKASLENWSQVCEMS